MYKENLTVRSHIHTEHINTNRLAEFWMLNMVVIIVTGGIKNVMSIIGDIRAF
jgi:hypothetical protein